LGSVLLVFWALVLVWISSVAFISFLVIGPRFSGRGATPLFGARVMFFSAEHRRQLREYRALCVAHGKSLIWWRFVQFFLVTFPFVMVLGVALSLWAAR